MLCNMIVLRLFTFLSLTCPATCGSSWMFTITRGDIESTQGAKVYQVDYRNKSNQEIADMMFTEMSQMFPNHGILVLVYQCPPSYGEYRQLRNSFAELNQSPGRYALVYLLQHSDPDFKPLDEQIRKNVDTLCQQWCYIPFWGWYTLCMRTYFLDWVGVLSDTFYSYASYIYNLLDESLSGRFHILVTRRVPTTYGDTDVNALWSRNMPVVTMNEYDGFIFLVADLVRHEAIVISLDQ